MDIYTEVKEAYEQIDEKSHVEIKNTNKPEVFTKWFPEIGKKLFSNFNIKTVTIQINTDKGDAVFNIAMPVAV